jgi:hypothetical protein
MNNATLAKKIVEISHKQHAAKHFYLDKHHKVLSKLSKTTYASELQEEIYSLIQSETIDRSHDSYSLSSLINIFLLVGGSIETVPHEMIDRLFPSDKMRLSWIAHQFPIVNVWQDLVQTGVVGSVDFERAAFLEKNKRNIMGEIILMDILQDSLLFFGQGQFDEWFDDLIAINDSDNYFLGILRLFIDSMAMSVSIENSSIDFDKNSFTFQLSIEGSLYKLAINIYSYFIDEIYCQLNKILTDKGYSLRFVEIDLISDSGFLFGDFDVITQALSHWSIPWLEPRA